MDEFFEFHFTILINMDYVNTVIAKVIVFDMFVNPTLEN